jgi:hypothetical protein
LGDFWKPGKQIDFCSIFKIMRFIAIVFFAMLAIVSCKPTQSPLTREEVIDVIKQFDEGWKSKNMKAVDAVLAPSYIYFTQSGGTFSRDSVVVTAGSPSYSLESMSRSSFYVELYDNTALVSTRWQGKGVYHGVPFNEDQRCSITIIKHNNKVEILSEHCTPIKSNSIFH